MVGFDGSDYLFKNVELIFFHHQFIIEIHSANNLHFFLLFPYFVENTSRCAVRWNQNIEGSLHDGIYIIWQDIIVCSISGKICWLFCKLGSFSVLIYSFQFFCFLFSLKNVKTKYARERFDQFDEIMVNGGF